MLRERVVKGIDRNSEFFHAQAVVRKRRKVMLKIKKGRRIVRSPRMIKVEAKNFYKALYRQKPVLEIFFLQDLVNQIYEEEGRVLEVLPTTVEIK